MNCPKKVEFDGAPCAVKAACTVRSGGKSSDYIKGLPIAIWCEITGNQTAHGWRRNYYCSTDGDSTAYNIILIINEWNH